MYVKEKKESWSWEKAIEDRKKSCWMCDEKRYSYLDEDYPIQRIIDNASDDYYVVVPKNPHVFGHILIVLKQHRRSLADATVDELNKLNEAVDKWSKILSKAFDDCGRVYFACLNDEGHLHYHLLPVRDKEKPYCGHGLKWLGDLEEISDNKPFDKCGPQEKEARAAYIKSMVEFLSKRR
jgi:diadenosine tetraphosphate (Ap4A) HIT family hydrolase